MMNLDPHAQGKLQFNTFAKLMSTRMPEDQQVEELRVCFFKNSWTHFFVSKFLMSSIRHQMVLFL